MLLDVVVPLTDADDFGDRELKDEAEQQVCTRAASIIAKTAVAPSHGHKVDTNYDKYRQIMFGKEDDEEEQQDDDPSFKTKAPKASTQRTAWTVSETNEINANYEYTQKKPDAKDAKRLIEISKSNGGLLRHRSRCALQNKLIREWNKKSK